MDKNYPHLFSPIKVGKLTLKSRLIASPISLFDLESAEEHRHTISDLFFYKLRAAGGAAIVTLGDSIVHPSGNAEGLNTDKTMIYMPKSIPFLCDITDEIHRYGAWANIELNHDGRRAAFPGRDGWGVEDMITENGGKVIGMNEEMIDEVVDGFAKSALNAKKAGFDMVMLHAGHGWLLGQFLSPFCNHRTDRFGGSLENRARILMMIIDRVHQFCGRDFPIEVRISGDECTPEGVPGFTIDQAIELAKMLDGKIDLLHVSAGTDLFEYGCVISHPSMFSPHGMNVKYAKAIKPHVKMPVVTVGSISDPEMMEEIISSGAADIVACGRSLIADPYLPDKARKGLTEEIRPCMRCFQCLGVGGWNGNLRCSVNPIIGRAWEAFIPAPATEPKTVLIAGGGPGGMQAALTAIDRGHKVILCEKEPELGGTIRYGRNVWFKADMMHYMDYMIDHVMKSGAEIRLNTEVTNQLIEDIAPDCVICAVGATPIVPPIKGIEKATSLLDSYMNEMLVGDKVVIIGGGLAGIEAAIEYGHDGKHPVVIEMRDDYAPDCNAMHRFAINTQIENLKTDIRLNAKCILVEDNSVTYEDLKTGETVKVEADTILYAAGMRPRENVVEELRSVSEEFQWIGDCRKAGQVVNATRGGYEAAMNI